MKRRINMNPLTKEQSDFATEHHGLIYAFLRQKRYPVNEFYGIAASGYLRAVRIYTEREDLQNAYAFSTIAFKCMRTDVGNHFRAENCPKRNAVVCLYDEDIHTDAYADSVWEDVLQKCAARAAHETLLRVITPDQRRFAMMRADGYSDREIARRCGTKPSRVVSEIKAAGGAIISFAPELLDLIAA
jgi:RNA polymerase sigma-70 factor (ECF subfamily)